MPRFLSLLIACLATLSLPDNSWATSTGTAGSTKWEVNSPFSAIPSAGYVPVTLTATNLGNKETRANYKFSASVGYYNQRSLAVAAGSMTLPPLKAVSVTHWIWRGSTYREDNGYNFLSFEINTPAGSSSDTIESSSTSGSRIGISRRLSSSSTSYGNSNSAERVITFDPKSLPPDWRVFSGLHAVFLHTSDWDGLSPGVRDALRTWVGFGGYVRIADSNQDLADAAVAQLIPAAELVGVFAPNIAVKGIQERGVENEVVQIYNDLGIAFAIGAPNSDPDLRSARYRRNYDYDYGDNRSRQDLFPLRDEFGRRDIPYFFVCMLLIVFAVLVGPVALRLWAGPGKRHRLFLTTPVLSLSASGLMLVIMLFQDGIGIEGRRFVLLDLAPAGSSQPNALVYQEQFSRAGMVGSRGFAVEEGLFPIVPSDSIEEGLTVRDGQARGDWFSSRRDRSMVLAGSVPVRWSVTHEATTEDLVTLRLESPVTAIEEAWFIDAEGLMWMWTKNSPGSDGTLTFKPAGKDPKGLLKPMFERCSGAFQAVILDRAGQTNQRNRLWALIEDGNVAARASDPKIDWKETNLVLTSKVTPKSQ